MELLLQLVASILLTSVHAASWPYREIVGVGQSESPVFVVPVYGVAPAIGSLSTDEELPENVPEQLATVVSGPVTGTTIVEGSSSGPVTVLSSVNAATVKDPPLQTNATEESRKAAEERRSEEASEGASEGASSDATEEPNSLEDTVLIRGASSGPVTLVAASAAIPGNAPSAATKTAASSASVAIENAEESTIKESSGPSAATITETIGVASEKAVIGPSTGPIFIVGPTAPPLPTDNVPTVAPIADTVSPATIDSIAAVELGNETESATGTAGRNVDVRASGTATAAGSGNSTVSTSAKVNLITPAVRVAASAETSSIVVSAVTAPTAHASDPAATVSGAAASALLVHPLP